MANIRDQLRRNTVALISLVVAITSLAYNSWRNEASEGNRNSRTVAIEMLIKLGDLDRTLLDAQWGMPGTESADKEMHIRAGWAYVITIRDMGSLLPAPASESSKLLFNNWSALGEQLGGEDRVAFDSISTSIDDARNDVLRVLRELD